MKQKFENKVEIRGWIWDYELKNRATSESSKTPNMDYVTGWTDIATDEDGINIVRVSWGFLGTRRIRPNGNENNAYPDLNIVMKDDKTWKKNGKEEAPRVRITGSIETNDFVTREGELVSPKQVTGNFFHFMNPNEDTNPSAKFSVDMLAQAATMRESVSSEEYMELKGFVFTWGDNMFPVTFSVPGAPGQAFFEGCDISTSEPYFGKVWGEIRSTVQKIEREVDDSQVGFGQVSAVDYSTRTLRTWDVDGANINLGLSDETVEQEDLNRMEKHREERLADVIARAKARNDSTGFPASASKAQAPAKTASTKATPKKKAVAVSEDDFEF